MDEQTVLSRNSNFVARVIDKETVLLPIYKTSHEINCIYTLNPPAARAWQMFDGKKTVSEVRNRIIEEFDTTPSEAQKQLTNLLKDLTAIKALIVKYS